MARAIRALALLALAALVAMTAIALLRASAVDVGSLRRRVPRRTAMMLRREAEARARGRVPRTVQYWIPYDRISPTLRRAVLVAEDDAFFQHGGLDWSEIQESARRNLEAGRIVRGGSTITQQLAKNLWLGPERTPWRKIEEVVLALRLERELSKRRILELYLNLIEWGDGIYGAEAAARRWYGTSASALDARQAVRLAAVIINPRRFSPLDASRRVDRRARLIAGRLYRRGAIDESQYRYAAGLAPRSLWEMLFGPPAPERVIEQEPAPAETSAAPADSAPPP